MFKVDRSKVKSKTVSLWPTHLVDLQKIITHLAGDFFLNGISHYISLAFVA